MNTMLELANHIVAASRQSAADQSPTNHARNPSIQSPSVPSVPSVNSVLKNTEPQTDMEDILENLELQLEHARAMAEHSPNVFLKASMNIASMEMFSVLNRFDTVTLSKRLEEKPELFFQLLNSQCALMKAHLDQQKFEFRKKQAKAKQRERKQKLRARKPILITAATIGSIHTQVRQAAGLDKAPSRTQDPTIPIPQQPTTDNESPAAPNPEPSTTRNSGGTETFDLSPGNFQKPTSDDRRLAVDQSEGDAWSPQPHQPVHFAAPSSELACSPT